MTFIVILTLLGVVLMLTEILLVPGIGIAGVLGLLAQGGACFYAFSTFGHTAGWIVTLVNVLLVIAFLVFVLRARTWKRFTLSAKIDSKVQPDPDSVLAIGDKGRTVTRLSPIGTARIEGRTYEVKSLEGMLDSGVDVEVVLIEDNKVIVKPISETF